MNSPKDPTTIRIDVHVTDNTPKQMPLHSYYRGDYIDKKMTIISLGIFIIFVGIVVFVALYY